jgi:hypothetical protein
VDGIYPDCVTGSCLAGIDQLEDEDMRLLEVRWLLAHLSEMGLAQQVVKEFRVVRDDLLQLALIESECRKIAQPDTQGEPSG